MAFLGLSSSGCSGGSGVGSIDDGASKKAAAARAARDPFEKSLRKSTIPSNDEGGATEKSTARAIKTPGKAR